MTLRQLLIGLAWGLLFSSSVGAQTRLAIADFELSDVSALPNQPQELVRTATIRPLLLQSLVAQGGDYQLVPIDATTQAASNAELGYLFHFNEAAVTLGKQVGADWILVSQHSKPSFLFSYLLAHLIEVKTGRLIGNFDIELKGNHEKVIQHGVARLAKLINASIPKTN